MNIWVTSMTKETMMKNKILIILTIFLLALSINSTKAENGYEHITSVDVKLGISAQNMGELKLYSDDGFEVRDIYSNLSLFQTFEKNIVLRLNGQNYDAFDAAGNYLTSIATNKSMKILSLGSRAIKINNKRYRGYLCFSYIDNQLSAINNVDLEEYLYGVVPREMPSTFSYEALKAQAVAARSYAVCSVTRNKDKSFDLYDSVSSQVYGGFDAERDNVRKAVDETRGQILLSDGKVVNATYSSSNGGYTADANDVWGTKFKYLISKEDKYSINEPNYNWSFEININDLISGLKKQGININSIDQIYVKENNSSKRVKTLAIKDGAKEVLVDNYKFKNAIGANKFKSSLYAIEYSSKASNETTTKEKISNEDLSVIVKDDVIIFVDNSELEEASPKPTLNMADKIKISGHGWGHGVGLSQWGANNMAKAGLKYDEILKFYYDGAEIFNGN